MSVLDKLEAISNIITEIGEQNPFVADVLGAYFVSAINTIQVAEKTQFYDKNDLSGQLEAIAQVFGVPLEKLVSVALDRMNESSAAGDKPVDDETLNFITNGLDGYERFIAANKSKDNLDFLTKNI